MKIRPATILQTDRQTDRRVYIDFLKVIAIYMVLFNHTGTNGFVLFTVARQSALYPFYLFNAIFIKIAVPLFFMASGALLLGKTESIWTLLKNRFLKYIAVLVIGSVIAYFYTCFRQNPQDMSLTYFIKKLYSDRLTTAYWYLYAYLAYILMLPLLRRLAQAMSNRDYGWMFLMFGCIQSLSIIEYLLWQGNTSHNGNFSFFITTSYIFYPCMGYFIDRRLSEGDFTRKRLLMLSLLSVVAIVVCCFMTHYHCTLLGEWKESTCQTFFNTLIFLPTITVFYAAKMWFMKHEIREHTKKFIITAGSTTFGIFLTEQIWRDETKQIFLWLKPWIHTLPACWVWIAVACLVGGVVTYFIKKIPGIRKFI